MKEMQADYRIRQNQTRQEEKDCISHSESGFDALRSAVFFYKKNKTLIFKHFIRQPC